MAERHWLVDSSIYIYKGWFLTSQSIVDIDNQPANAVHGFLNFVGQLLDKEQPEYIGFAFDQKLTNCFRKEIYPAYKANRTPTPEALKSQFKTCQEFIRACGFAEFSSNRYEADDLIGTWVKHLQSQGHRVAILTADKDLNQLLGPDDICWEYLGDKVMCARKVKKKFGVHPYQIADQLAIAGDKTDNIPGVEGIGMATAAKLLRKFGDIETLVAAPRKISSTKFRGAKQLQILIEENIDLILLSRKLTGIYCDVESLDLSAGLGRKEADIGRIKALCEQLKLSVAEQKKSGWTGFRKSSVRPSIF